MYKITYFGYDHYSLLADLGPGDMLDSRTSIHLNKKHNKFKSEGGALKYICNKLKTAYRKKDWDFEEDLNPDEDMWVLHIIVDKKNKYASHKMIEDWKNGKLELVDLLVNVKIDKIEE